MSWYNFSNYNFSQKFWVYPNGQIETFDIYDEHIDQFPPAGSIRGQIHYNHYISIDSTDKDILDALYQEWGNSIKSIVTPNKEWEVGKDETYYEAFLRSKREERIFSNAAIQSKAIKNIPSSWTEGKSNIISAADYERYIKSLVEGNPDWNLLDKMVEQLIPKMQYIIKNSYIRHWPDNNRPNCPKCGEDYPCHYVDEDGRISNDEGEIYKLISKNIPKLLKKYDGGFWVCENDLTTVGWEEYMQTTSDSTSKGTWMYTDGHQFLEKRVNILESDTNPQEKSGYFESVMEFVHGSGPASHWFIEGGLNTINRVKDMYKKDDFSRFTSDKNNWYKKAIFSNLNKEKKMDSLNYKIDLDTLKNKYAQAVDEKKNRQQANIELDALTKNKYFESLPIKEIGAILTKNGFDASVMEGIYTGRDGSSHDQVGNKTWMRMTWHKMESGRYEVLAYLS